MSRIIKVEDCKEKARAIFEFVWHRIDCQFGHHDYAVWKYRIPWLSVYTYKKCNVCKNEKYFLVDDSPSRELKYVPRLISGMRIPFETHGEKVK